MVDVGKNKRWWHALGGGLFSSRESARADRPLLARFGEWAGYAFAILAVSLALFVTYAVEPLRKQPPTLLFFVAVILTSWYAGLRAGFCATILSMVTLNWFLMGNLFSMQMELVEDGTDFVTFAVVAWLVSSFHDRWRQTHRKLIVVEQEIQIARRIQQRFFPASAPSLPSLEVAGACFPADDTGGDFFDYISLPDEQVGIVVGDVSGHGLGPAIIMVLLRAYLRALALTDGDPDVILTKANRLVCEDTKDEWFATAFLLRFDFRGGTFCYAAAGHECYVLDTAGEVQKLPSTGMPLGIVADATIGPSPDFTLRSGQTILLLSDGIVESHSRMGEPLGLERVRETVRSQHGRSAQAIVEAIYQTACDQRGKLTQEDDMTIVVVQVN